MIHLVAEGSSFLNAGAEDFGSKTELSADFEENLPGNLVCCVYIYSFWFAVNYR